MQLKKIACLNGIYFDAWLEDSTGDERHLSALSLCELHSRISAALPDYRQRYNADVLVREFLEDYTQSMLLKLQQL